MWRAGSGMLEQVRPLPYMYAVAAIPFWVIFVGCCVVETITQLRGHRNRSGEAADRRSLLLVLVCSAVAFTVAFCLASWVPVAAIGGPRWPVFVAGLVVMIAGMGLRQWAIMCLGRLFTTTVRVHGAEPGGHPVVDTGPYRWVRHPSYTGVLASIVGTGLALGNWAAVAVLTVIPTAAIVFRIRVEEAALLAGLDEPYRRYTATVRTRLIPGLW